LRNCFWHLYYKQKSPEMVLESEVVKIVNENESNHSQNQDDEYIQEQFIQAL
jgi:hypothetical protein